MGHIAMPHTVDSLGFLVGGLALALAFVVRMVVPDRRDLLLTITLFVGGSALMLLNTEPFVQTTAVAIQHRILAISLVLAAEAAAVIYALYPDRFQAFTPEVH